jgi:hypothetical protein
VVLDWLTDGKPKLFRSATEGNYLVRLTNVSLTPNETLGRMIHTFNATASEVGAADIQSLITSGFVKEFYKADNIVEVKTKSFYVEETAAIFDLGSDITLSEVEVFNCFNVDTIGFN